MIAEILLPMIIWKAEMIMPYHPSPIVISRQNYDRSGEANGKTIRLYPTGRTVDKMVYATIHEIAHNIDEGAIVGAGKNSEFVDISEYVKVDDKSLNYYRLSWINEKTPRYLPPDNFFCSKYGEKDPYEDFAECAVLYVTQGDSFRYFAGTNIIAHNKYDYIKSIFNGREFSGGDNNYQIGNTAYPRNYNFNIFNL